MEDIQFEVRRHIDDVLEAHMVEEDRRFTALQQEIKDMRNDIKALTEAWQQAKGVVSFMKWIAGIGGSVAAWFIFFKDHWK
jgi:hypothetical protein